MFMQFTCTIRQLKLRLQKPVLSNYGIGHHFE